MAQKLVHHLKSLIKFSLDELRERPANIDADNLDFTNELLENYLNLCENLIKGCPRDIAPFLNEILKITNELISHDPNSTINLDNEDKMDIEYEGRR